MCGPRRHVWPTTSPSGPHCMAASMSCMEKRHVWRNVTYERASAGVARMAGAAKIDNIIVTPQHHRGTAVRNAQHPLRTRHTIVKTTDRTRLQPLSGWSLGASSVPFDTGERGFFHYGFACRPRQRRGSYARAFRAQGSASGRPSGAPLRHRAGERGILHCDVSHAGARVLARTLHLDRGAEQLMEPK
jgi:hypothetical protein